MAIDIVARGLAMSLVGDDGRVISDKMPLVQGTSDLTGFTPIGGLTDASMIEGRTVEDILLMILYGFTNPTLVAPKVTIALQNENEVLIIGRQSVLRGTVTFDRGLISPANGTSGFRSGAPISYTINNTTVESTSLSYDFELEVTPTERVFLLECLVKYAEGEQPINSIGKPFDAPLPAGILHETLECRAAQALYNVNYEEMKFSWFKQNDGEGYSFIVPSETLSSKQTFIISSELNVIGVKAFSPLTQTWEWIGGENAATSLTCFNISLVKAEELGETTDYIKYINNQPRTGERELRVYVK